MIRRFLPPLPLCLLAGLFAALLFLVGQNAAVISGRPLPALFLSTGLMPGGTSAAVLPLQFTHIYLPQLVIALLCGGALGFSGAVFQTVLLNPLAAPATLGVSSGAQLALTVSLLLAPGLHAAHPYAIALAGSALAWAAVMLLSRNRLEEPLTVILSGMIVSFTLAAATTCVLLLKDNYLNSLFIWGAGDLTQTGWDGVRFLLPKLAAGLFVVLIMSRVLALLALGGDVARSLGVPAGLARLLLLSAAILIAAAVTATVGIIAFVGLAAPHLARLTGARHPAALLCTAFLTGALLLGVVDQALQYFLAAMASFLPAGALTGLLGAPLLLLLLRKQADRPAAPAETSTGSPPVSLDRRRQGHVLAALAVLCLAVFCLALLLPLQGLAGIEIWRLPRVVAALLSGSALACAGVLVQRLVANPMASPESLGISAGAVTGLILVMIAFPLAGAFLQSVGAIAGAAAVCCLSLYFGRLHGFDPRRLILVGIAVSALADAFVLLFFASGDPRLSQVLALMSGSTYRAGPELVILTGGLLAAGLAAALFVMTWLDIIPLGAAAARALGVPLKRARVAIVLAASLLTAAATLLVGPISFVGLVAPHIARLLGLRGAWHQLCGAMLAGATVVVLADFIGRQALRPYELPAGLLAIFVGAISLAVLIFAKPIRSLHRKDTTWGCRTDPAPPTDY